ncbi:hypothetical protein PUMCH_001009 [Australozyma saopauloensis]|uniref:Cyclin n=1 Tax=Australozyma saopauloensis TaxID=291208 RepID=A0AAX4H5Q4_9ASCO|nr:hypothetical protein PUMCH_001009 [[Candida] saopauloensis]
MASNYTNDFVSDIPLKRPAETFVDDPESLDEVSMDELEFDLSHDIKDINKLHIFHALAVLNAMLADLIWLGSNRELFEKFRREQLEKNSIDVDELSESSKTEPEQTTSFHDDDLPLPVESFRPKAPIRFPSVDYLGIPPVPDVDAILNRLPEISLPVTPIPEEEDVESSDNDLLKSGTLEGGFISTESLLKTTSFDVISNPISEHSCKRLNKEVLFHMNPKTKQQAEHLLKAFTLAKAPPISVEDFLLRIRQYLPSISVSVYIHSAYMLYKLCVLLDVTQFTHLNVYRFILALLRCSVKKLEDIYQKQKSFATVGGVDLKDLCKIEVSFLYLFNFKLMCSEFILNQFLVKDFVSLRKFCRTNLKSQQTEVEA